MEQATPLQAKTSTSNLTLGETSFYFQEVRGLLFFAFRRLVEKRGCTAEVPRQSGMPGEVCLQAKPRRVQRWNGDSRGCPAY